VAGLLLQLDGATAINQPGVAIGILPVKQIGKQSCCCMLSRPIMTDRFVYNGPFDTTLPDHYLIINDIEWWLRTETEIYVWMDHHLPQGRLHHRGMCVVIPEARDVVMFLLRWAQ